MRFLLPILFALLFAGRMAHAQEQEKKLEERLYGPRDEKKVFDLRQSSFGGASSFNTGEARISKDFQYDQKATSKGFWTNFFGTKKATLADSKFATNSANTSGRFEIPGLSKKPADKTAPVRDARESGKTLATRGLPDGKRQFLGRENDKMRQAIDAKEMANWRAGSETVTYSGSSVDKYSDLKELSIDDVREILNKNK